MQVRDEVEKHRRWWALQMVGAAGGEAVGGETHLGRKVSAVVFKDNSHCRTKVEENKHQVDYCFAELRRLCRNEDGDMKDSGRLVRKCHTS
jgi:hypothetical protein